MAELINSDGKEAWQKKQAIEALGLLFKSIHAPLYREIDWDYWKASCRDLGKEHDTNYRVTHGVEYQSNAPSAPPGAEHSSLSNEEINKLRIAIRRVNHSIRTEKTYTDWVQRFLNFNRFTSVSDIDKEGILKYLEYLAIERKVAPKTQSIALNAISFYFKHVLGREISDISQFVRAKSREKLPVILTRDEVSLMLDNLSGLQWLVVSLLYGSGLRIMEAIRLRVQDIDFGFNQVIVRDAKGNKERAVPLPTRLIQAFKDHLSDVKSLHAEDIEQGYGRVYMPQLLIKKYGKSDQQWVWQYVFPSKKLSVDPRSNIVRRHHINESTIQRSVRNLARKLEINKRVTCHTFRHSYATHLLERGMGRIFAPANPTYTTSM